MCSQSIKPDRSLPSRRASDEQDMRHDVATLSFAVCFRARDGPRFPRCLYSCALYIYIYLTLSLSLYIYIYI